MILAFDIGGTSIKYGIVDLEGKVISRNSVLTGDKKDIILDNLENIIFEYQSNYQIEGIGISAPGIIRQDGMMTTAGAIKCLYGLNLKQFIKSKTNLPVCIENDANAVAIAEKWVGNAIDMENYICLVLGTGVGGGIVINGKIYRGYHGMAGEFGWTVIDKLPESDDLETVSLNQRAAPIMGLCQRYNKEMGKINLNHQYTLDSKSIFIEESLGNEVAHQAIEQFLVDLAIGVINTISCFDPQAILIGGGISENKEFQERFQMKLEEIKGRHESINRLRDISIAPVLMTKLNNDAGLIGSVYPLLQKNID